MGIDKKIYYVWIGNAAKPDIFYKCKKSWEKNLPDYEIIEINENNFDINYHLKKNKFFRECYNRKIWAYVSDYIRVHYMYENSGIYVDTDMEIIKDITPLIENKNKFMKYDKIREKTKDEINFLIGYENEKFISVGIFATEKKSSILKDIIDFYESDIWKKPIWTIPKIMTYIFEKKYGLTEERENILCDGRIVICPSKYFYPFSFKEKFSDECISENTYGIHWWKDSWGSLKAKLFLESKHLKGIFKLIKKCKIILRYYFLD